MKMALALLCRGNIEEKYRCKSTLTKIRDEFVFYSISDIFSLVAYPSTEHNQRDIVDRHRLSILFQQAIVVRRFLIIFHSRVDEKKNFFFRSRNNSVKWPHSEDRMLIQV